MPPVSSKKKSPPTKPSPNKGSKAAAPEQPILYPERAVEEYSGDSAMSLGKAQELIRLQLI